MSPRGLAVVLSGFPRRSETFAFNELLALASQGRVSAVFATKPGDGLPPHPAAAALAPLVETLPEGSAETQAEALVGRLAGRRMTGIHGYFAHHPAAVAEGASRRLGIPYGFSTHARDARKVAPEELRRRGRGAACVVACNPDVAGDLRRVGVTPSLIPHGVDLQRFRPGPMPVRPPLRLLAVGRLVPKKGFGVLLDSLARLRVPVRLAIVGEGPERPRLDDQVQHLGLRERVDFLGGLSHDELPAIYAAAHAVVVPSITDATGDRDGLPNVALEAMACGRPVVASAIGGLPSAVVPGRTGWLTPPGDVRALASTLSLLAENPTLVSEVGRLARTRVEQRFELGRCTARLSRLLEAAYA